MSRASANGTSAFRIALTNEQQLFYQPGEWLEGAVTLSQFQRIPARAVRLKFRGRERARWPAEALSGEVSSGSSWIFNERLTLWGFAEGSPYNLYLEPGVYVWPFRFKLPDSYMPPTFEHPYGQVRYSIKAYIDILRGFNVEHERCFVLSLAVPIGMNPKYTEPMAVSEQQAVVSFCCLVRGRIKAEIRVQRASFHVNERIPVTFKVSNSSSVRMLGVRLALQECSISEIGNETREWTRTICEKEHVLDDSALQLPAGASAENSRPQGKGWTSSSDGEQVLERRTELWVPPEPVGPAFSCRFLERHYELVARVLFDDDLTSDLLVRVRLVQCNRLATPMVNPDCAPSLFNPTGGPRSKTLIPDSGRLPDNADKERVASCLRAPFCFEGLGLEYPVGQAEREQKASKEACTPVHYPTFFSADFLNPPPAVAVALPTLYSLLGGTAKEARAGDGAGPVPGPSAR